MSPAHHIPATSPPQIATLKAMTSHQLVRSGSRGSKGGGKATRSSVSRRRRPVADRGDRRDRGRIRGRADGGRRRRPRSRRGGRTLRRRGSRTRRGRDRWTRRRCSARREVVVERLRRLGRRLELAGVELERVALVARHGAELLERLVAGERGPVAAQHLGREVVEAPHVARPTRAGAARSSTASKRRWTSRRRARAHEPRADVALRLLERERRGEPQLLDVAREDREHAAGARVVERHQEEAQRALRLGDELGERVRRSPGGDRRSPRRARGGAAGRPARSRRAEARSSRSGNEPGGSPRSPRIQRAEVAPAERRVRQVDACGRSPARRSARTWARSVFPRPGGPESTCTRRPRRKPSLEPGEGALGGLAREVRGGVRREREGIHAAQSAARSASSSWRGVRASAARGLGGARLGGPRRRARARRRARGAGGARPRSCSAPRRGASGSAR